MAKVYQGKAVTGRRSCKTTTTSGGKKSEKCNWSLSRDGQVIGVYLTDEQYNNLEEHKGRKKAVSLYEKK